MLTNNKVFKCLFKYSENITQKIGSFVVLHLENITNAVKEFNGLGKIVFAFMGVKIFQQMTQPDGRHSTSPSPATATVFVEVVDVMEYVVIVVDATE